MTAPAEMTLDELKAALAPLIPSHATFDGWSDKALAMAAGELGVPAERAQLAFPGGATEMIDAWFDSIDRSAIEAFPPERIKQMKMRERIRALLTHRIETANPNKEALRRALAILAFPVNAALGASLAWRAVDRMWRIAGDTSTDFNHYTKRATLLGVYSSTLLAYLDDDSEDLAPTRAFLDRRIEDVMRIEKMKDEWRKSSERLPSLSRFLGRLRYPAI